MKIPEGWPTEEMIDAGEKVEPIHHSKGAYIYDVLMAAFEAAPTPPARKGLKVEFTKEWCMKMAQLEGDAEIGAGMLSTPASAVEPVAWTGKGCGVITGKAKARMIEEGKYGGEFAIAARSAERHDIPLYARHATNGLRKAAEEAIEVLEWYGEERMANELRAALDNSQS